MLIVKIVIGLILVLIGFLLVWKSEWFLYNIGRIDWAEQKLSGGTRIFYKLIGIGIIIIGFFIMTNLYQGILNAFVSLFI
jgi:hypothetical protein